LLKRGRWSTLSETSLHIAHLMRSASRDNAGVFVAASGMSRALAQYKGLEQAVFAVRDEYTLADRVQWGDIPVHAFPMLGPGAFSFAPGLDRAVRNFKPHIVHQHGLWTYSSLVARRGSRRNGARVIISIHGMLTSWALQHSAQRKKAALWLYEQDNLNAADCIHALTLAEVEEIRAIGVTAPVCLVNNGIDLPELSVADSVNRNEKGKRELLYVGRLHAIKGILELLHGWGLYKERLGAVKGNKWHLKIVGWGEDTYRIKLQAAVAELGLESSVEFAGPKFGDDLLAAYQGADAFILTSHSEAMPMTVLEAWSFGLPVIMTPDCGLSEGFTRGAAIKTSTSPKEIAEVIAEVTQMSQATRHKMGRAGRELVEEHYSWQSAARSIADVYNWLVDSGSKPDCVVT